MKHNFTHWRYFGVIMHGEAGLGWVDLCTFLVSRGLDVVCKWQNITGGPCIYLKGYFMTVIDCTGYESWLASGDLTA